MKKIFFCLVILLFIINLQLSVNANSIETTVGTLYINDEIIEHIDNVLFMESSNCALLPLRTIFEALGANVDWDEETGSISIEYENEFYKCTLRDYDETWNLITLSTENKQESLYNDYFLLSSFSKSAPCIMINDRTYLHEDTAIKMFNYFNFDILIDVDNKVVRFQTRGKTEGSSETTEKVRQG